MFSLKVAGLGLAVLAGSSVGKLEDPWDAGTASPEAAQAPSATVAKIITRVRRLKDLYELLEWRLYRCQRFKKHILIICIQDGVSVEEYRF
jgi:hypothetical protein